MTVSETPASKPRARTPRAPRPEGQWKIDGKTPLNRDEEIKQEDPGASVKQRVIDIYSKEGFDSIVPEDLYPRMKFVGMYTQRKQNLGTEHTGKLDSELHDKFFMMRIRLEGGQTSPEQLRAIGEISQQYARNTADFTDRQNIQLHWIRIEDAPAIWEKLDTVGLNSFNACGDVPRIIVGSPVAGVAKDEIVDATPAIEDIKNNYMMREEFGNLPRKYKTGISGNSRQDITHEIQDIAFQGVRHPELGPGFQVFVGGGLSTNPMLAQSLGVFVTVEQVPEVWANVTRIYRDYGFRRLRNRARLKFLVAKWGAAKFRQVLEDEYLGYKLPDGPDPVPNHVERDHVGVHEQKDGKFYVGAKPTVGHTTGEQLVEIADLAERFGLTRLRTTVFKELLFLDVEEEDVPELMSELDRLGISATPSEFRRGIISCTGMEFCKLAHTTTKSRAIEVTDELEERFGDLDVPLTISVNGCPNACARSQIADIGLKGQTLRDADGNYQEGFQVHLGGVAYGEHQNWGRKIKGHKVTNDELGDYIGRLVENFQKERQEGEQFRDWVLRADEASVS